MTQKEYVATGLLAIFIVIAFFGIMLHINRMVFGAQNDGMNGLTDKGMNAAKPTNPPIHQSIIQLPFSCRLALILAAVPVLVLGFTFPSRCTIC